MKDVILSLLDEYYPDQYRITDKAVMVLCPWHEDTHPSCNIYLDTGTFFCWTCGKAKSAPFYEGMVALGVPPLELTNINVNTKEIIYKRIEDTHDPSIVKDKWNEQILKITQKVKSRSTLPVEWSGFRDVDSSTLNHPWFYERIDPSFVFLADLQRATQISRLPRIGFRLGGRSSNCLHEVYLRSSKLDSIKTINTIGLSYEYKNRLNSYRALSQLEPPEKEKYIPLFPPFFGLSLKNPDKFRCGTLDPHTNALFLVEGAYDWAYLTQCHMRLREINGCKDKVFETISILGTPHVNSFVDLMYNSPLYASLVTKGIPLIVAFDHDDAGDKAGEELKEILSTNGFPTKLLKFLNYPKVRDGKKIKDPADMNFSEYMTSIKELI